MSSQDTLQFEGIVEGAIAYKPKGDKDGYDPIFIPNGFQKHLQNSHQIKKIKSVIELMR